MIDKNMLLACSTCGFKETEEETFDDTEISCELCGSHSAIRCPECGETYDHCYSAVCEECGKVIQDSWSKCDEHPDADTICFAVNLRRGL